MVQNKAQLLYFKGLQPSEVDNMAYWEYEIFMEEINRLIEEEDKKNKKQEKDYNIGDMQKRINNMSRYNPYPAGFKAPSVPTMPSIKY